LYQCALGYEFDTVKGLTLALRPDYRFGVIRVV
jgi:hypothetical protein